MPSEMTSADHMPDQYRSMLVQLMESQAYRELAAAHMFGYGLRFVPEKWMKFMVWHIQEETEHYHAVAKMYREFTKEEVEPRVRERLAGKPVPFAESWFELAVAQFLYDRGGFWQLEEYEECAFGPYRVVIQNRDKEEAGHQHPRQESVLRLGRAARRD